MAATKQRISISSVVLLLLASRQHGVSGFATIPTCRQQPSSHLSMNNNNDDNERPNPFLSAVIATALTTTLTLGSLAGPVFADTPASSAQKYDGFVSAILI